MATMESIRSKRMFQSKSSGSVWQKAYTIQNHFPVRSPVDETKHFGKETEVLDLLW